MHQDCATIFPAMRDVILVARLQNVEKLLTGKRGSRKTNGGHNSQNGKGEATHLDGV